MKSFGIFIFMFFLSGQIARAQSPKILAYNLQDPRDNQTYPIIQIGETLWFQENLRFESKFSFCPNISKKENDCKDGNFYPYTELDTICPKGWRIPTAAEWESYFDFERKIKDIPIQKIKFDTLVAPEAKMGAYNNSIIISDTSETLNLFQEDNLLRLKPLGWVQGKRKRTPGTITLWAKNEEMEEKRYHLHIGKSNFVKHSHTHHIDDKKRKRRKFLVRCVCESEKG